MRLTLLFVVAFFMSGCSNFIKTLSNTSDSNGVVAVSNNHPLKTQKDLQIEKNITSGTWVYQRQGDDCKDTTWTQTFYKNRYYKSGGSACLLTDAFSVDAENWHIKNQVLYITNLSPKAGDDIILRYGISFLNEKKLVLSSGQYTYTFLK